MKIKKVVLLVGAVCAGPAFATNGMNMEGYGPVAAAMGGASYAYDNGTAGLINNPATLALMPSGTSRLDLAIGALQPDITARAGAASAVSGGNAYYMPAFGYVRKDGRTTWGIGMMAQGGMGTEYGTTSFMSNWTSMGGVAGPAAGNGQEARSELGIGRVMMPLGYDVADNFRLAGTIDYLWGGLDMRMPMSGNMFASFAGFAAATPLGSASGTMLTSATAGFPTVLSAGAGGACPAGGIAALGGNCVNDVNWAMFDFSQGSNKMKQRATTSGWAGNIGFVWQPSPQLSIGGVYHAKTSLKDMEGAASLAMGVNVAAPGAALGAGNVPASNNTLAVQGRIKVIDFQWPETFGIGMSFDVNNRWTLVADYKHIGWASSMKSMRMSFSPDAGQYFAGTSMDVTLNQNWKNQSVVMLGAGFKANDAVTVRFGGNFASNPVPSDMMHPLFPATVKNHYTFGMGVAMSKSASLDFSLSFAPKVTATNANMGNLSTDHAQTNWQLMFSNRF